MSKSHAPGDNLRFLSEVHLLREVYHSLDPTCPWIWVSYGPMTMRFGATCRPCGWTFTPASRWATFGHFCQANGRAHCMRSRLHKARQCVWSSNLSLRGVTPGLLLESLTLESYYSYCSALSVWSTPLRQRTCGLQVDACRLNVDGLGEYADTQGSNGDSTGGISHSGEGEGSGCNCKTRMHHAMSSRPVYGCFYWTSGVLRFILLTKHCQPSQSRA